MKTTFNGVRTVNIESWISKQLWIESCSKVELYINLEIGQRIELITGHWSGKIEYSSLSFEIENFCI